MEAKKNLLQRMLAVQSELKTVAKNLTVQTGVKTSYKAVGETDVLNAVTPLEAKYGIYSYPYAREIIEAGDYEKESREGYKTLSRYLRLKTVYRFLNADDPADFIDITSYADGIDSGDKATGKAMTYCDKYALMKAYKIRTGDDPDQQASEEYSRKNTEAPSKQDVELLNSLISEGWVDEAKLTAFYKVDSIEKLTKLQVKEAIKIGLRKRAVEASEKA